MRILGIDPGARLGFVLGREDGSIDLSGVHDLTPGRGSSPGVRYLKLRAFLQQLWRGYGDIGLVMYEQAHYRGGAAAEQLAGYTATLQAWCAEHKIEFEAVHSARLKKAVTGKGNADKAILQRIAAKAGFSPQTGLDDETDAYWLYRYGVVRYTGENVVPLVRG